MKTFTEKDIKKVEKDWYKIEIVGQIAAIEQRREPLIIDLTTSQWDKRDIIISKREGITVNQDAGCLMEYSKKHNSFRSLKAELVKYANEIAAADYAKNN